MVGPALGACAVALPLRWLKKRPLLVVEKVFVDEAVGGPAAVLGHVDADGQGEGDCLCFAAT